MEMQDAGAAKEAGEEKLEKRLSGAEYPWRKGI